MKNADYRVVARSVLMDSGFDVRVEPGQGYLPGSRLIASKARKEIMVAVKASQARLVSFTRQANNRWRTLHVVDLVVAVVPAEEDQEGADVYTFERKPLERAFNRAWKELANANRPLGFHIPVFIPLDESSRKKVGHDISNLKDLAIRSVYLTSDELLARSSNDEESYVDQFRRRFAAENGVDIDQVMISIVGKRK